MPQLFTNNARALLASGITDSATSLTVEASKADLFPTANVDSGSVPSANNWFKVTLQDSAGNVEIVYVRTRTAGSGIMSNLLRGQEGTTARAFSAGTVVGLRITAADVEGSIAAAANSVQLSGNQTIAGTKTFSNQIVASGGVQGNVTGDVSGNAGTVTNGVYTTGDQTIGGVKTFSGRVNGKTSGTDATPAFFASTTGGAFAAMWTRRGAPFFTTSETTGSSYAPALAHQYTHNGGWAGVYSVGVLNHSAASPGSLVIHHIDSGGSNDRVWQFRGDTGEFAAPGNITANGQFIGNGSVPPGAVMHFAMNSPPTGWLRANGATVSRTTFAALFNAIGTTYGAGDGSTTFRLPDLRGEFLRGWDDGRGVDSGRVFGSAQAGEIQSHTHDIGTRIDFLSGGGSGVLSSFSPTGTAAGAAQARGGTETRPRNIALLACIKF